MASKLAGSPIHLVNGQAPGSVVPKPVFDNPTLWPLPRKLKQDKRLTNGSYYPPKTIACSDEEWKQRVDLAAAYRLCHKFDLIESINNHLTAEIPGTDGTEFLVFPFGLQWSEVSASDLLVMNQSGELVRGEGFPEQTAFWIHSRIHLARPGKNVAVLHTHQKWTTALCCLKEDQFPMVYQTALFFDGDIVYDPAFHGRVVDEDEGNHIARVMGDKSVYLHANHGVIVTGLTVAEAFHKLFRLEYAAEVIGRAMSTGRELKVVNEEVVKATAGMTSRKEFGRLAFEAWKRSLLDDGQEDFAT